MISSKADYRYYLEADRIAHCQTRGWPRPFVDETWRFQRLLRKLEYYTNCKHSPVHRAVRIVLIARFYRLSQKLGFTIYPNTCGPGLCLPHWGPILISSHARLGANCRIHVGAGIGSEVRYDDRAPRIGNNVYVGPGAKVFGDIVIGDDVAIGANAVVTRSFEEPHQTIGGIPARTLNDKGTEGLLVRATEQIRRQTEQDVATTGRPRTASNRGRRPARRIRTVASRAYGKLVQNRRA